MFAHRKLIIATMHGKESVIAPVVESALAVHCVTSTLFETDRFGTFSGEMKRSSDALETARLKCHAAMDETGYDLAIASEGSFGPHPIYFFSQADDEILMFIDRKNGIEIWARELSTSTNLNGQEISTWEQLEQFAESVGFPAHGLILRESVQRFEYIQKGIRDKDLLRDCFHHLMSQHGQAYVETDMRAMHNPTRMKVIENATRKLVHKILSACPSCSWPGFDVTEVKTGLPCASCGAPTQSTRSLVYSCLSCSFSREKLFPNDKETEEPRFCDFCNP
jgi:hypothetical protein